MPKYTGLPDIDNETPEVLEYGPKNDVLEEVATQVRVGEDQFANKSIDTSGLGHGSQREVYETSEVDTRGTDFSGSFSLGYSNGYRVSQADETIEARIARLRGEIEGLSLVVPRQAVDLKQLLDSKLSNNNQLDRAKINLYKDLGNRSISESHIEQVSKEEISNEQGATVSTVFTVSNFTSTISSTNPVDYAQLEERICLLESKLGVSLNSSSSEENAPISLKLEDLKRRVALLTATPQGLDKSVIKLKEVILAVDRLRAAGPLAVKTATSTQDDKINALYNKIDTINQVAKVLPNVVARLNSLRAIHSDAAVSTAALRQAESTLQVIRSDLTEWKESIEKLEKKLEAL